MGDLDRDGLVDVRDLLEIIANWGTECGDVNGDNTTDVRDLVTTLGNWGTCDA